MRLSYVVSYGRMMPLLCADVNRLIFLESRKVFDLTFAKEKQKSCKSCNVWEKMRLENRWMLTTNTSASVASKHQQLHSIYIFHATI